MKRKLKNKLKFLVILGATFLLWGCSSVKSGDAENGDENAAKIEKAENVEWEEADKQTLRYVFDRDFEGKAGVCLPAAALSNSARMEVATSQFNSVTMENEMKPESFLGQQPTIGDDGFPVLDFTLADTILREIKTYNESCIKEEKKIQVRGHVLVWHSQTPEWFFHEDYDENKPYVSKEIMLARMENYIRQVMEHFHGEESEFRGMIYAWDVVNEAINDTDGGLRTDSSWFRVFYKDTFIEEAFVYANRYAPAEVKLFYNDYNDTNAKKADGICKMIEKVKQNPEARIDGMGMQGHYDMNTSALEFEESAKKYAEVVDEIQITELDMKSSNDYDGSNQDEEYQKQAYQYKSLYDTVVRLRKEENIPITSITFWGTDDGNSWLNSSNSVGGSADGSRPQCPLLFDAAFCPKPAFWAFVDPEQLEPFVQEVQVIQSSDFEAIEPIEFGEGDIKASFIPIWDESGLSIKVSVKDTHEDDTDEISFYVDLADSRCDGAEIQEITVARKDAEKTNNGYETVAHIETEELSAFSSIGFDICITSADTDVSWNDTSNCQDEGSSHYGRLILKPFVNISKGTVNIDGDEDDVWKDAEEIPLTLVTSEGGQPESSAVGKALWDEKALYIWMEVSDPNPDVSGSEVHTQDSIEVFVDEANSKTEAYGDVHKQYRVNYENEHSFNGPKCVEDNITSVVTKTDKGYIAEMAVLWTEIEPQDGTNIGFELQINDCKDGSRLGMLNWYDSTNTCWSTPASFGTARLIQND